MNCEFNWCEFYNVFFGGIVTGIIASILFIWLTDWIESYRFFKWYKHLISKQDKFDWIAFSMRHENGRIRQENPNGSIAKVVVKKKTLQIILEQVDKRKWIGELKIESFEFGILTFKYEMEHEYGRRECIIGSYSENGKIFDYLFLIPTNNRIYTIQQSNDLLNVKYNYGDEVLVRERTSA